jgi:hypothetical protein
MIRISSPLVQKSVFHSTASELAAAILGQRRIGSGLCGGGAGTLDQRPVFRGTAVYAGLSPPREGDLGPEFNCWHSLARREMTLVAERAAVRVRATVRVPVAEFRRL